MCLKIFRRDLWLKLMPCQSFLLPQSLRKLIVAIDNSAIEHLEKFSLFIGFPVWFEVFFFKQQSFKRIALQGLLRFLVLFELQHLFHQWILTGYNKLVFFTVLSQSCEISDQGFISSSLQ